MFIVNFQIMVFYKHFKQIIKETLVLNVMLFLFFFFFFLLFLFDLVKRSARSSFYKKHYKNTQHNELFKHDLKGTNLRVVQIPNFFYFTELIFAVDTYFFNSRIGSKRNNYRIYLLITRWDIHPNSFSFLTLISLFFRLHFYEQRNGG